MDSRIARLPCVHDFEAQQNTFTYAECLDKPVTS
jgi:hypothetical protein